MANTLLRLPVGHLLGRERLGLLFVLDLELGPAALVAGIRALEWFGVAARRLALAALGLFVLRVLLGLLVAVRLGAVHILEVVVVVGLFVVADKLALAIVVFVHIAHVAVHFLDVFLLLFVRELLLERNVLAVLVRDARLGIFEDCVPDIFVDIERRVAVCAALETVEQLFFDRLFELGGAQGLDFACRFAALRLFLDTDELGSGLVVRRTVPPLST